MAVPASVDPQAGPPAGWLASRDGSSFTPDVHAALTNDHKALSRQMEHLLHALHAQSRAGQTGSGAAGAAGSATAAHAAAAEGAAAPPAPQANSGSGQQAAAALPPAAAAAVGLGPFAVIDELAEGSPAAAAGLQLHDQLCSFGGVTRQTPGTLQAVASLLHEGQAVEAVVLRHGAPLVLSLTPQKWAGRGLLGCHLRPC